MFMNIVKSWLIPIIVSISLFLGLRPVFAQIVTPESESNDTLLVGSEVEKNAVMQVYYVSNGEKHFITGSAYANESPDFAGDYITWMGQAVNGNWQVFLYDLSSGTTTQITSSGNNQNPKVSDRGEVVWEGWVFDSWQIFNFDGMKITQLTSGDTSVNPGIEGDYIIYARKDITGTWRSAVYSVSKNRAVDVTTGIASKYPKVRNGKIILGGQGSEKEFGLNADDLFILDLIPLTTTESAGTKEDQATESAEVDNEIPETVTEDDIFEELNATELRSGE
ncbi:MAG: Cell surface protein [Microgenomates group bacterium GW2011_GWF1_38_5]|nr:MAG: Cell surface protein [Microgenomates group bacterium GW2011_GWF1_38_5]